MRTLLCLLFLGACAADKAPAANDAGFACGENDHACCPDDAAVRCMPGLRCENERGKGHWVCNPDVPPDEKPWSLGGETNLAAGGDR